MVKSAKSHQTGALNSHELIVMPTIATILSSTIFAACTGIVGASVVMMGLLTLPAMLSRDYDKALVMGTICAGGTLIILIPPSIKIVVYGPAAGISVGKLFVGAFFLGFLLSALYTAYVATVCFRRPENWVRQCS